jgi:hypothetical protein
MCVKYVYIYRTATDEKLTEKRPIHVGGHDDRRVSNGKEKNDDRKKNRKGGGKGEKTESDSSESDEMKNRNGGGRRKETSESSERDSENDSRLRFKVQSSQKRKAPVDDSQGECSKKSRVSENSYQKVDDTVDQWLERADFDDEDEEEETELILDVELEKIRQEFDEEPAVGENLPQNVADLFNIMAKAKMSSNKHAEKIAHYKRPGNVEVQVTKVNPEIWVNMDKDAKASENRVQAAELDLYAATYALGQAATVCMTAKQPETKRLLKPMADAAGLVLKALHDLNIDRRLRIVNSTRLDRKYKKLATGDLPLSGDLFGHLEFDKREIDLSTRLSESLTPRRGRPYQSYRPRARGRGGFRGSRGVFVFARGATGGTRGRGRGHYQQGYGRSQSHRGQYY